MLFKFGNAVVEPQIENERHETSRHTGKPLRHFELMFNTTQDPAQLLQDAKDNGVVSGDSPNEFNTKWSITDSNYSYEFLSNSPQVYTVTVSVTEQEDLRLQELVLPELALIPYQYSEEIIDGQYLTLRAYVELDSNTAEKLHSLLRSDDTYFPVIRRGINEKPLRVRFGRWIWSETESGTFKYELNFVEDVADELPQSPSLLNLFEPNLTNVNRILTEMSLEFSELTSLLIRKGVITEEEHQQIQSAARKRKWEAARQLLKVDDVDTWSN